MKLRRGLHYNQQSDRNFSDNMTYQETITIEPDKRGGKPCIRRMRITVYDVLGWLAVGMSTAEIIDDFPELTASDIKACLEFAADREHRLVTLVSST
jgi:uncharacterized protein (DUF433 family)